MAHRVETAFVFDFAGALIDSVYQHVLAWQEGDGVHALQHGLNSTVRRCTHHAYPLT